MISRFKRPLVTIVFGRRDNCVTSYYLSIYSIQLCIAVLFNLPSNPTRPETTQPNTLLPPDAPIALADLQILTLHLTVICMRRIKCYHIL